MSGRRNGVVGAAGDALKSVSPYVDRLAHDEKLRRRLIAAIGAGAAARSRAKRQTGLEGLTARLRSDPVLRTQVTEGIAQLQKAKGRLRKSRSHKTRNVLLILVGSGVALAAVPKLRSTVLNKVRGGNDDWATDWSDGNSAGPTATTVEQETGDKETTAERSPA